MNVWTYWSGPKPAWIDICLRSIERWCRRAKFHLLTPETADRYLGAGDGELHPRWKDLPPGVGTDCLRAFLLAHGGGLWIDADTVCIRDPAALFDKRHDPKQFLYSRWSDRRVIAGYVYSPAGHPVTLRWLDGVNSALRHADTIGWGDLGEKMLTPLVAGSTSKCWQMPLDTFLPIDIDTNVRRYFEDSGWRDFASANTIAFGLNFSWMQQHRLDCMTNLDKNPQLMIHRLLSDNRR